MDETPHIVAVCGSLRDESYTRESLLVALAGAEATGATIDLIDLRELDLPMFDADHPSAGDADELAQRITRADGVILGTPMYHGSYSAPLKNALDYCGFEEFENTSVGLLAVAGGRFPVTALDHLRSVCRSLDAWVLPYQAVVPQASRAFDGNEFADSELETRVSTLGRRLVQYANIRPDPATFESEENVGA
ncbi:NADPH-dependent FMN reductase [Natranaeroarchaeum aerophilus]|uniref:NAD(P)H-dependent oxidoreductase n=1 Tax=Natranaeroarchaeum aerophilus TaxID=2917711 RepID=A0AAE3FRJ9_9EURY|nr:NAD(P)H-dependent oxidoreductase [Natranaeroarchaeum aerophilus]MCL9813861.1 NAD(P)H-dependent oxidoreductase [Natranaeroarchaeum aerophilus]